MFGFHPDDLRKVFEVNLSFVHSVVLKSEIHKLNIVHLLIWVLIAAQVKSPVQV